MKIRTGKTSGILILFRLEVRENYKMERPDELEKRTDFISFPPSVSE